MRRCDCRILRRPTHVIVCCSCGSCGSLYDLSRDGCAQGLDHHRLVAYLVVLPHVASIVDADAMPCPPDRPSRASRSSSRATTQHLHALGEAHSLTRRSMIAFGLVQSRCAVLAAPQMVPVAGKPAIELFGERAHERNAEQPRNQPALWEQVEQPLDGRGALP